MVSLYQLIIKSFHTAQRKRSYLEDLVIMDDITEIVFLYAIEYQWSVLVS